MQAAAKRSLNRRREQITLAHTIASLSGVSKPPPLSKLLAALEPKAPMAPMTEGEIMDAMALWGASTAGVAAASTPS